MINDVYGVFFFLQGRRFVWCLETQTWRRPLMKRLRFRVVRIVHVLGSKQAVVDLSKMIHHWIHPSPRKPSWVMHRKVTWTSCLPVPAVFVVWIICGRKSGSRWPKPLAERDTRSWFTRAAAKLKRVEGLDLSYIRLRRYLIVLLYIIYML